MAEYSIKLLLRVHCTVLYNLVFYPHSEDGSPALKDEHTAKQENLSSDKCRAPHGLYTWSD